MTYQPERYKNAESINIPDIVANLRNQIGELEDLRSPTEAEVENAVEEHYSHLLENEKMKVVQAFMRSEEEAATQADKEVAEAEQEVVQQIHRNPAQPEDVARKSFT